ncbi:uncharacterized protein LOC115760759 isoform X1 [Drosophila novamexicana]|uniref:uncharacterized protein LOC115760759 isoform X1 n=1 Tax=Drosophila novamexicana TaxID=47314 RepID=UPI0011E58B50|nr:uncharacterized protein LOC115760759 isoform X1 [Drosophila novamexicana]
MPEPLGILWSTPETKKKAPIIKVSCGIGDTDGFPAFDVESDVYDSKDDEKWGFLITGGAEFHMPLTVFQVTPNGIADKSGVRLGDIILEINEEDATQLTLAQAHERINATPKKVHFLMRNMEEDDAMGMYEAGEEKSIVMRVPKPMPPPKGRVLPSSIELRLLEMQRKLSAIAEIPKILSSTLATVSQSFGSLSAEEEQQQQLSHMQRKFSYDEDALDYELLEQLASGDEETEEEAEEDEEGEDAEQEDDLGQVPDDEDDDELVSECLAKQLKDLTPESDYASEVNYATNEPDNDNANDKDQVQMENDDDLAAHKTVYYMKLPAVASASSSEEEDDDEDDSDFLSTTYTWNLRYVPKLRINEGDVDAATDLTLSPQLELPGNAIDTSKVRAATPTPTPMPMPTATPTCTLEANVEATIASPTESQKLLFKLDNLERSWPWADREKIIYKQSTCHLVPRKPLGIVGQRIQLLAKQELLHKDKTQ